MLLIDCTQHSDRGVPMIFMETTIKEVVMKEGEYEDQLDQDFPVSTILNIVDLIEDFLMKRLETLVEITRTNEIGVASK